LRSFESHEDIKSKFSHKESPRKNINLANPKGTLSAEITDYRFTEYRFTDFRFRLFPGNTLFSKKKVVVPAAVM
jgi:hypothetical protein